MDHDALVNAIVARVAEKLQQSGEAITCSASGACSCGCADSPGLLILTQDHGTLCHSMLESPKLLAYYHTDCALMKDYQVNVADYEAVILFNLTNDALSRLAGGVCDTPFTHLAQQAILAGKKIFVPEQEVELLQYAGTAPAAYYQMMQEKLTLLKRSGIVFCPADSLEDAILSGEVRCASSAPAAAPVMRTGAGASITKRVVTERDVSLLIDQGVSAIHIGRKAIVTDLARELAHDRQILLVRD